MKKFKHAEILKSIHNGKTLSDLATEYECSEEDFIDVLRSSNSNPKFINQLIRDLKRNGKNKPIVESTPDEHNTLESNKQNNSGEKDTSDTQNKSDAQWKSDAQNTSDAQDKPDTQNNLVCKKSYLTVYLEKKDSASLLETTIRTSEASLIKQSASLRSIDMKLHSLEIELEELRKVLSQKKEAVLDLISKRDQIIKTRTNTKTQKNDYEKRLEQIQSEIQQLSHVSILAVYPETLIESKLPLPRDFSAEYTKNDFAEKFSMFLESGLVDNITPSQGRYILAIFEYCKVLEKAKRPYSVEFERADYQALFKSLQ